MLRQCQYVFVDVVYLGLFNCSFGPFATYLVLFGHFYLKSNKIKKKYVKKNFTFGLGWGGGSDNVDNTYIL